MLLTDTEQKDLHAFLMQHTTLQGKASMICRMLTNGSVLTLSPSSGSAAAASSQLTQVDTANTASSLVASPATCLAPATPNNIMMRPMAQSDTESEFSLSDMEAMEESKQDRADEDELINNTVIEECTQSQQLLIRTGGPGSQMSTRAMTDTCQWAEPFFQPLVAAQKPAHFYMVIFALHNTSVDKWLVKVGITTATDKTFKERYSIYYRYFYYKTIPLPHCKDKETFTYYDNEQKVSLSAKEDIKKYKITNQDLVSLSNTFDALRAYDMHIGESTGEVYTIANLADLESIKAALEVVAAAPYPYGAVINLPYRCSTRLKQLTKQLFDNSAQARHYCLARTLYRDGHFSAQNQVGGHSFDFPISIQSIKNVCEKMYERIKDKTFVCTWRHAHWEFRILWVGIGLAEESILLVLYFRQLGVFIRVFGLELNAAVVRKATESVRKYNLEEHFNIQQKDVLKYEVSEVRKNKIDIVYTTAVVDHIFMWKLHMLCIASSRVHALVAPKGGMANLHNIQNNEGTMSGPSLGFYPMRRVPKVIQQFCEDCEVVGRRNETYDADLLRRPLRVMVYTRVC